MRADREIKKDVEAELKWVPDAHESEIEVTIADGIVTLRGFVSHHLDRFHAENAARRVAGCAGVINEISVHRSPDASPADGEISRTADIAVRRPHTLVEVVKQRIEAAFRRDAEIDASDILVETQDDTVFLKGTVRSLHEKAEAERAARSAPGAIDVVNGLAVCSGNKRLRSRLIAKSPRRKRRPSGRQYS